MKRRHWFPIVILNVSTFVVYAGGAVVQKESETVPEVDLTTTPFPEDESTIEAVTVSATSWPTSETAEGSYNDTDALRVASSLANIFGDISPSDNVTTISNSTTAEYDGPVRKCAQRDSAGLNKCLQQVLKDLKPRLAGGVPEINLPPMEPLKLSNVAFQQGSGPVRIVAEFTNVEISGLSNFSQSNFWVDVPKRTLDFDLIFPQLSLVGNYELSGNLFFIPIGGNGNFHLNLGGTRSKGDSSLGVFRNSTVAQVVVKKTDVNLEIESIKVHLTNLFNGDQLLGTVINNFLNENSQEVFEEVKPQIGAQVGELLSLLANRAMAALSTNQFDDVPFNPSPDDVQLDDQL